MIHPPNTTSAEMTTYMLQNFRMELMRFNLQRKIIKNENGSKEFYLSLQEAERGATAQTSN
jgi:hypothetical protein